MSLRITAGELRGRKVPVPPEEVRPTSERARQAFFNVVGPRIAGATFLDLFAGSGIFSFEALSRGAAGSVAVDQSRRNVEAIATLARKWNVTLEAVAAEVIGNLHRLGERAFDIVYADPPYDFARYEELLAGIGRDLRLAEGAVVAIEHRRRTNPFTERERGAQSAEGRGTGSTLAFQRTLQYGEVWISYFSRT